MDPIVYLDCTHLKTRDSGAVRVKALYLAHWRQPGVLGLWTAQTEDAKFWLQAVTELKNRGVPSLRHREPLG